MLHAQKRRPAPGFKHTAGRCGQPAQTQGVHAAAALFRAAARQQSYTSVDSSTSYRTFTPQVIDISNLLGDGDATQQQVQQVRPRRGAADKAVLLVVHLTNSAPLCPEQYKSCFKTMVDTPHRPCRCRCSKSAKQQGFWPSQVMASAYASWSSCLQLHESCLISLSRSSCSLL